MSRFPRSILPCALLLTMSAGAFAQQAVVPGEEFALPDFLFAPIEAERITAPSTLTPISVHELSEMRAAGVDPSWIPDRLEMPDFQPLLRRVTQSDHPLYIEQWTTHYTNQRGFEFNDSLRFSVGRTTELRDGNISGSQGSIGDNGGDHVASFAQDEGEYDMYDLSVEWEAIEAGDVTLSVLSGLKAIEANIGKRVNKAGGTEMETEHRVAAMPMIGSGVRWQISEDFSFSGAAITHPLDSGETLLDFNASTDLRISRNMGFVAGYRIIRSSFEVGEVNTELDQEGLFARFEIKF